jgi:hypothetical protein
LSHICKLKKALYGLKQDLHAWFSKLSNKLIKLGFVSSRSDKSLFINHTSTYTMLVLIYVDNITITCSNHGAIQDLLTTMDCDFVVKELEAFNFFGGS